VLLGRNALWGRSVNQPLMCLLVLVVLGLTWVYVRGHWGVR
jgi:hypothetical protein